MDELEEGRDEADIRGWFCNLLASPRTSESTHCDV